MNSSSSATRKSSLRLIHKILAPESEEQNIAKELNGYKSNVDTSIPYLKVALDLASKKVINSHDLNWIKENLKVAIGVISQGRKQ